MAFDISGLTAIFCRIRQRPIRPNSFVRNAGRPACPQPVLRCIALGGGRTHHLRLRRPTLYPIELPARHAKLWYQKRRLIATRLAIGRRQRGYLRLQAGTSTRRELSSLCLNTLSSAPAGEINPLLAAAGPTSARSSPMANPVRPAPFVSI